MTLFLLYLLALLDGLLCGLRSSMGRCPLIRNGRYYWCAMVAGAIAAQTMSTVALAVLLATSALSTGKTVLRADLEMSAGRMLWIFLPYAALVVFNLALRLVPSTDIRSATSVLMLGPLTAIRPVVMIFGVLYGILPSRLMETWLLGLFILCQMLSLELVLNWFAARKQSMQIRQLQVRKE